MGKQYMRNMRKCLRCDWIWFPRKPTGPIICPHCKSAYWNKPKKLVERNGR